MTLQTRKRLGTAALCVGGAALLLHPACLIAFGAGAWAGSRGRDWLKRIWDDREVKSPKALRGILKTIFGIRGA